jgi:hypothetical protein
MKATTVVAALLLFGWLASPAPAADDSWADFRFLIGEWVGDAPPGGPSATFTLQPELGGNVLVRKHVADVPAAQGRPAGKHEDLMVVYRDKPGKPARASYFDNEGHVIQYAVNALPDKTGLVFVSEPDANGMRFRLTYTKGESETVAVKFEIAPPGKSDQFRTYLEGKVRRKSS